MKQGDVVIMPFPFTDLTSKKIRPAVVISNERFNQKGRDIILIAISTKKGIPALSLPLRQPDLASGTLQKDCFVRMQNIFTLEKRLVIKTVAQVQPALLERVLERVHGFF